jgi:amidase
VNAIVTFLPEEALRQARRVDASRAAGKDPGPLAGLPNAYKDMIVTKGIRTTFGSPIFADNVPAEDHVIVERLKAAGVITLGKTNTPEFAAGSQTFNPVFGTTRNPWDLDKTCGGSSGGAAVAVACGMLPFADGSDLGGSLRNPGNFNNVVGFRPTPGACPTTPHGRVGDDVGAGADRAQRRRRRVPALGHGGPGPALADLDQPSPARASPARSRATSARCASPGGARAAGAWRARGHPVDRASAPCWRQRRALESLGCIVEDAHPDLSGAGEVFHVLRALSFAHATPRWSRSTATR